MATWQKNPAGGLHPLTSAIVTLGNAMFDPSIEHQRRLSDSQIAVDQAQIGNYTASAGKTNAETALLDQRLAARGGGLGNAMAAALTPGARQDPAIFAQLAQSLVQSGDGTVDLSGLGDIFAQYDLGMDPANPAYGDTARNALVRMGKIPDQNSAMTMGEGNAISARDAQEAMSQAVTTTGMEQAGQDRRNNATISNAFLMNEADNATSVLNQGSRNSTALQIAGDRNDNRITIADMGNTNKITLNNADNATAVQMNNADNASAEGIAANQPLTLNEVRGQLAQEIIDQLPKERRDQLALQMLEDGGDGSSWVMYQDTNNVPYLVDTKAAAPVPVPLFPDQPVTPGPTTRVTTPGSDPRVPQISPATNEMLDALISEQFLKFDEVDPSLLTSVKQRAGTIMQLGDPTKNIQPGNPEVSVSQAIMELVAEKPQTGVLNQLLGSNNTAVPAQGQPQPAPAPVAAPAAGAPQPAAPLTATGPNGEKIQLVNGQWVPVQQ